MKKQFVFLVGIIFSLSALSQVPQAINYQAVYKDASTGIYKKSTVAVIITITQDTPDGIEVFTETHSTITNENGLFTLMIGSVNTDDFAAIKWADGPYFLKINVNGTEFGTSQILSVPYAYFADEAGNVFSGKYSDLTGTPGLFTPESHNHAESEIVDLKHYSDEDIDGNESAFDGWDKDASDDFDGDYQNLANVPTEVSAFNNDAGYITEFPDSLILKAPDGSFYRLTVSNNGTLSTEYIDTSINTTNSVTDINGNVYKTVTIGTQTWMATNLRVMHFQNGDVIAYRPDPADWYETSGHFYCWYDTTGTNYGSYKKEVFGALYSRGAINRTFNNVPISICPDGWHVPSLNDWETLFEYLGGAATAGSKLKEEGTVHWDLPNPADNSTGFSAVPGGYVRGFDNGTGHFSSIGISCQFWTSTDNGTSNSSIWLSSNEEDAFYTGDGDSYGLSVRCIKD